MTTEDHNSKTGDATSTANTTSSFLHMFLHNDDKDKTSDYSFLQVVEKLKLTLSSLEGSPSADLFESSVQKIQKTLKQAERYVKKHMSDATNVNNPQKHKKLLATIYRLLQEEAIDLVLRLNVEMPLEEGDDPAQLENMSVNTSEERFVFPPLLHQVLSNMDDQFSDGTGSTASLSLGGDWSDHDDGDSIASLLSNDSRLDPSYVPWQFHNLTTTAKGWSQLASPSSASFHSSASRVERRNYYQRIQALRALPQDTTRITQIRVVLAQLDPGDTTPVVLAGQTVATAVLGPLYALNAGVFFGGKALLTGKNALGDPTEGAMADAKLAATSAFRYAQHSFLHFLLEFDLKVEQGEKDTTANSTITCTLERCADDVYLYQGESARPHKKQVFYAHADHLRLRDLIKFRNQQRQQPYRLRGNNCKDFVWQFLLQTFPSFAAPSGYSFNSSCQAIYGSDWPPSDFNETMQILSQQQPEAQAVEERSKAKTLAEEEEKESPQETFIPAALQRKRVNLWIGSFGKDGDAT